MTSVAEMLDKTLAAAQPEALRFNGALRLLAKYRCNLIQSALVKAHGVDVQGGPFKGMHFVEQAAEGCHIPKLLGCYEQELHPFISGIGARNYDAILNIGCAEGYYAAGFKRLLPAVTIVACDTQAKAQAACGELARRNDVTLDIRGTFAPADFGSWQGKTLVWCDIEGGERDLLDPVAAPRLRNMDIVVELHPTPEHPDAGIVPKRFGETHNISIVWPRIARYDLPPMFRGMSHLDQLLAVWEWRSTPTPWAIMLAKSLAQSD